MEINELKEKYAKAHAAYLKHKDTNQTNNTEALFIDEAVKCLKGQNNNVITVPDCLLNYLGIDFIVESGSFVTTYDLKVCQHLNGTEVLIDAYKHDNYGNWFCALDNKINDYFIFINADNIIIVPFKTIRNKIPPMEECFFMKRDLYKTTKKAIVDLSDCRKLICNR